jgi:2-oxoglutarate ferredoxin oxidoreductase subunit gamma
MLIQIRLGGIGGQGIKVAGTIIGEAAIENGYHASQVVTYTPATRGGLVYSDVQVSDKPIPYPVIETPDVLATIAPVALQHLKSMLGGSSTLVVDSQLTEDPSMLADVATEEVISAPFTQVAESVGSSAVVNMVLLGFLEANELSLSLDREKMEDYVRKSEPVRRGQSHSQFGIGLTPLSFERAIVKAVSERFKEMNLKAFRAGWDLKPDPICS